MGESDGVAVIELVSPGNKDRPEKRNAFVGKCAALLQKGVAVSIVDVVTTRQFNLYAELMAFVGQSDPTMRADQPHLYAASCRWVRREPRALLESWRQEYNQERPHGALGYLAPEAFAAACLRAEPGSATLRLARHDEEESVMESVAQ